MDIDLQKYSIVVVVILVVSILGYYMGKSDGFESMKKLLEENTDVELIRNTDEPTKDTTIIVNNDDFFNKSMTKGELGVAESYMDGDWDTPDLERTLSNMMSNKDKLEKHIYSLEFFLLGMTNYITTYLPNNTLHSSKSNIDYTLYSFKDSLSVCFNYKDFEPEDLCTKLYESNSLMVGFGSFQNKKFVRLVVVNCENSYDNLMQFFKILEEFTKQNQDLLKKI